MGGVTADLKGWFCALQGMEAKAPCKVFIFVITSLHCAFTEFTDAFNLALTSDVL